MLLLLLLIVIALLFIAFYLKFVVILSYFSKRGICGPKPKLFYGNIKNAVLKKIPLIYEIDDIYKNYKGKAPFVGIFSKITPYLLILDSDLIKQIVIRDFKHFRNNDFSILSDKKKDPIMGRNPFFLRNDEWKEKRAEIAPALTQNKLKSLHPIIDDVNKRFTNYIKTELSKDNSKIFDAREICSRFTADTVSSCIYGIDAQSFTQEKSQIMDAGQKLLQGLADASSSFFPKKIVPKDVEDFFIELMDDSVKYRLEHPSDRDDFLAFFIGLKQKRGVSDIDIAAHANTFFVDGFDTTGIAISNALYELGKDQRVQEKLREEILDNSDSNGNISYDKLIELPYLDQVLYESLRLHPPIMFSTRECSEPIELEGLKGKKTLIEKGALCFVPIYCIHRDPEYYADPESFNPERFDPENGGVKAFRDKCVLIPFGDGPRICLGFKFAIVQAKEAVAEILRNFKFTVNDRTEKNLQIDTKELFLNLKKGGLWLNFESL